MELVITVLLMHLLHSMNHPHAETIYHFLIQRPPFLLPSLNSSLLRRRPKRTLRYKPFKVIPSRFDLVEVR